MKCPNCKYEILNSPSVCPICGFDIYAYAKKINGQYKYQNNSTETQKNVTGDSSAADSIYTYRIRSNADKNVSVPPYQPASSYYESQGRYYNERPYYSSYSQETEQRHTSFEKNAFTEFYMRALTFIGVVGVGVEVLIAFLLVLLLIK